MHILAGAGLHTASAPTSWVEHLNVPDLSCGTYSIPAGGRDDQTPHTEDEIYICTSGRARLWTPTSTVEIEPGCVAFVPAGEEHRFIDITENLTVIVIFGPAEYSRRLAQPT